MLDTHKSVTYIEFIYIIPFIVTSHIYNCIYFSLTINDHIKTIFFIIWCYYTILYTFTINKKVTYYLWKRNNTILFSKTNDKGKYTVTYVNGKKHGIEIFKMKTYTVIRKCIRDMHSDCIIIIMNSGNIFIGNWKNHNKNGFGIMYNDKFKTKSYCNYVDGKKIGYVITKFKCGKELKCEYKNGKLNGFCTLNYVNGNQLTFFSINNKILGYGCMKYFNGDIFIGPYSGPYKNDKFIGNGLYYNKKENKTYLASPWKILKGFNKIYFSENNTTHFMFNRTVLTGRMKFININKQVYDIVVTESKNPTEIIFKYKGHQMNFNQIIIFYNFIYL
jgi:hypothetical protein